MTTLYQYRIFCITENTYVYEWATTTPTTCPNNTADVIDSSSITIVATLATPTVVVDSGVIGTYQSTTIPITVPTGATGSTYTQNVSFPFDAYIWTSTFVPDSTMVGDVFNVIAGPNTTIGATTAPLSIGATILNVSPTIFTSGYITKGTEIFITDGTNTQDLGMVTAMDSVGLTITIQNALTFNFAAGSLIQFSTYIIKNQYIGTAGRTYLYGRKGFAARALPANVVMEFVYVNNTGTAKTLYFDIEYNYT